MTKRKTSYMLLSIASSTAALTGCGGVTDTGAGGTNLTKGSCDGGECPTDPQSGSGGQTSGGPCGGHVCGSVVVPPGSGGATGPCNGGPCGVIVQPPTGGASGTGPCGGHVCGVVITPPGAGGAPSPCNGGVCGVIVRPPQDAGPPGLVVLPPDGSTSGAGGTSSSGAGGYSFLGTVIRPPTGGSGG